jgi:hypothetical protein
VRCFPRSPARPRTPLRRAERAVAHLIRPLFLFQNRRNKRNWQHAGPGVGDTGLCRMIWWLSPKLIFIYI